MRRNYFAKLIKYMKSVYHIEHGLNKLFDGRFNPTYSTGQFILADKEYSNYQFQQ